MASPIKRIPPKRRSPIKTKESHTFHLNLSGVWLFFIYQTPKGLDGYNKIGLRAQNIDTNLGSIKNSTRRTYVVIYNKKEPSFLAQIAHTIAERTQNTTNPAKTTQPKCKSRNNAHVRPILPSND